MPRPTHIMLHRRLISVSPDWDEWLVKASRIREVNPPPYLNRDEEMHATVDVSGYETNVSVKESPQEIEAMIAGEEHSAGFVTGEA